MANDIKMKREPRFLKLTLYGTDSLAGHMNTAELLMKECAAHGYDRALVDRSNLTAYSGTISNYELAKHLSEVGFNRSVRHLAFTRGSERGDGARFFETACLNRGVYIRAFVDPGAAIEWLTE